MTRQIRADLGWFALRAGLGALVLISFLELGVLGVAISFAAFALAARRAPSVWPQILGAVEGWAAICLLVAFLNRGYRPCGRGPISLAPGQSYSCGGAPPTPWLIAALTDVENTSPATSVWDTAD